MKIFDFHAHAFLDALAPRAVAALAATAAPFGYGPHCDGTAAGTEKNLRAAGVSGALMLGVATNPRQEAKICAFALETAAAHPFFAVTGALHPDGEDHAGTLDRLLAAGVRGVKIHPDYAGVDVTDPRYDRLFGLLEERGMFAVTHSGFDPVSPDHVHADPAGLAAVIDRHPDLVLVAAHLGGKGQAEGVLRLLVGRHIWFDTSLLSLREDEKESVLAILKEHDPDKLLFGTDSPWTDPAAEIAFIEGAGLSDERREALFSGNAKALLGL